MSETHPHSGETCRWSVTAALDLLYAALALALHGGFDAVLSCQQGLIRRDQALAAGFAEATVDSLVARRRWKRVLPRTYVVGADPTDPEVRIRAGWLWAGEDSVVGGQAAAWWLGLDSTAPEVVRIYVPPRRRMISRPGYQVVRCLVPAVDAVEHRRVLVTSAARTCLDLARLDLPDRLDTALRTRKVTQAQLDAALAAARGSRGQTSARRARVAVADSPWSHPERALHALCRRVRISGWTGNSPIILPSGRKFGDLVFEDAMLVVEVAGRRNHGTAAAFDADRVRQNELVEQGWTVLSFTPAQIADDPSYVTDTIARTLDRLRAE